MFSSRSAIFSEQVVPGKPLGRHIHFDERSKGYRVARSGLPLVSKLWDRQLPALDQGSLGSCTANGAAGLLATAPFAKPRWRISEATALRIYRTDTKLDDIPGQYPPDDTGSTVLAAMKALVQLKYATSYHWCLSLDDALDTLSHVGPLEIGVRWYEGFDSPDAAGRVRIAGGIRGGHAFEVLGIDVEQKEVIAINSWGSGWGDNGRFRFSFDDFGSLLATDGEAATIAQ